MSGENSRSSRQAQGIHRVLAKLKVALDNEKYYEAHQMYRTLYFRYSSQQKYTELEELLFEGASKFFALRQIESGVDLAKLYLEILHKSGKAPDDRCMQKITMLYASFPVTNVDRDAFKVEALKWSSQGNLYPKGDPRLHQLLAHSLWNAKRYAESRLHFVHSSDGNGCGNMLVEFHLENGFPKEFDLFLTGTVLQLMSLKKHIEAAYTFKTYTESHPSVQRGPPYKHPLLNFAWLLLLAVEQKQSLTTLSLLVEKYHPSLERDPTYFEYLDKIGQNFFGVPPPVRPRLGGMFGGMFDSLLNAFGDDEDEVEQGGASVRVAPAARRIPPKSSRMEDEDVE